MKRKKRSLKELVTLASPTFPKPELEEAANRVWKNIEAEMGKHDLSLRSLYGDGWNVEPLDQLDLQVVTAASLFGEGATIVEICDKVNEWSARKVMLGTVMLRLHNLEKRDIVTSGFSVTEYGERALRRARLEHKHVEENAGTFGDGRSFETFR